MDKKPKKPAFLSTREFSILVFCVSLFLFIWPFLSGVHAYPVQMFEYLFIVWGIIIIILFAMSKVQEKD